MRGTRRDTLFSWLVFLIVDLAIVFRGFPGVHRLVGAIRVRSRTSSAVDREGVIAAVNDAVDRAAVWYPRTMLCLPRSVVATWLLRRYGVPAVMVIGVRKMPFYAHAWVEVDGRVVNDVPKVQTLYPPIDRLAPGVTR